MTGRRVPDGVSPADYAPGDYGRKGDQWWVRPPGNAKGRIQMAREVAAEDGA